MCLVSVGFRIMVIVRSLLNVILLLDHGITGSLVIKQKPNKHCCTNASSMTLTAAHENVY